MYERCYQQFETLSYENNCDCNSFKFSYKFSCIAPSPFCRNQKQVLNIQQVSGLVTKIISAFSYSESCSTLNPWRIQKPFVKEFSHMLFLFVV